MDYLYDFGDYWRHSLRLDMVIDGLTIPFPICCAGKLNCPPEDVGSLSGYYDFLKIMATPKHPKHKDLKEWVKSKLVAIDGKYDPEIFYLEKTNYVLLNLNLYIKDWENEYNK